MHLPDFGNGEKSPFDKLRAGILRQAQGRHAEARSRGEGGPVQPGRAATGFGRFELEWQLSSVPE